MSSLLNDMDAYNRVKKSITDRLTLPGGVPTPASYVGSDGIPIYLDVYGLTQKAMSLVLSEDITKDEYKRIVRMLYSVDMENHLIADIIINNKIKEL